jgi:hypothetical protein
MKGFIDSLADLVVDVTDPVLVLNVLRGLNKNIEHLHSIFMHMMPFPSFQKVLDDLCLEEIQQGIQGLPTAAPTPPPSLPCKSLRHLLPPPVGRNARQDSSSTNNVLNNDNHSSPARRTTTTNTMVVVAAAAVVATSAVVVGVAPPTPLPPRVSGPPTSTPGLALFRCGWVPGGRRLANPPGSAGYAGRCPSLRSSTLGRAVIHTATRTSAHAPWSLAGSSTSDSGDMVPMDELMGSTFAGQLQHHDQGPSYGYRLGG